MNSPGYAFALPHGWHRVDLRRDLAEQIDLFLDNVATFARDRDSRTTVLTRRRAREFTLGLCIHARREGIIDLFVFTPAGRPPLGPMCLSVLPVVSNEARPGASLSAEVARSLARPESLLSTLATAQGDVARVVDRWVESAAQWAKTTELALERLGIVAATDFAPEQRVALEGPLVTGRVQYIVDVPERTDCVLVVTFIATGGTFLSPQLVHADDIVRAFRWIMPTAPRSPSSAADIRGKS